MSKKKKEEDIIGQTRCLGMMHELKDCVKNMHHTLYSMKGKLSFAEAREYLGVSQTELNALVRDKVIPCTKLSVRKCIFDTADLDDYLENRSSKSDTGKEGHRHG